MNLGMRSGLLGAAVVAVLASSSAADVVIRLKDGTVHRVPVDPKDVESITFAPAVPAPAPTAAPAASAPAVAPAAVPVAQPAAAAAQPPAGSKLHRVGAGGQFRLPSEAAAVARDGDIVEIAAGVYEGDVAVWRANGLTLRGVGGRAELRAFGNHAEGKAIWVIKGRDTLVESIAFSGARVPDGNGAGIRIEGAGLTIRNALFQDNENGILGGDNPQSDIRIENSEFRDNGAGDGRTHNIYLGVVRSLTITGSNIHHAKIGHNIKSRAKLNQFFYNRIMDEADGTSSYAIDLEDGGVAYIVGNVIQQGPETDNWTLVNYATNSRSASDKLVLVNNTMVNDRNGGIFVNNKSPAPALLRNNIIAGTGTIVAGPAVLENNLIARAVAGRGGAKAEPGGGPNTGNLVAPHAGFADAKKHDYRLVAGSPAIDAAIDPGKDGAVSLEPTQAFASPLGSHARVRKGALDLGAFEAD